jgi:hypothetical protein
MPKGFARSVATVGTAATAATALAGAIIASLPVLGMAVGFGATVAVCTLAARKSEKLQREASDLRLTGTGMSSSDAYLN